MIDRFLQMEGVDEVLRKVESGMFLGSVYGASFGGVAVLLRQKSGKDVVVVCRDRLRQQEVTEEVRLFGGTGLLFPQRLKGAPQRVNASLERDRLAALGQLGTGALIVASTEALKQSVPKPNSVTTIKIEVGRPLNRKRLFEMLLASGYEEADPVELPGYFTQRGGIIDIFPQNSANPYRIELFGDEVDSIRIFDPATQESVTHIAAAEILIINKTDKQNSNGNFFEHLKNGTIFLIDGQTVWEEFEGLIKRRGFGWVVAERTYLHKDMNLPLEPGRRLGNLSETMRYLAATIKKVKKIYLLLSNITERRRVEELMREHGVETRDVEFVEGKASGGFVCAKPPFALLVYDQMLGRQFLTKMKMPETEHYAITRELEFDVGDYCVHEDYGICRFEGLRKKRVGGGEQEFLVFRFGDGGKVYVAPTHIKKVRRYIGAGRGYVRLSRLDELGKWRRRKQRVLTAVGQLAREMLKIHAIRMTKPGIRYPPDTLWQHEFEASFPFVETPDQQKVTAEVKRDMESPRPMDRLIAGDVGYGKTEVAIRAAFKAVQFGKQVAVLVPTTLLAEQHFRVFRERLADFPVVIECLNRFRTREEQKKILKRLADGGLDIIIGTHRLLSKDVKFRDLGLVIIDEEQRFGVAQKEHFKRLRATVDILSLTATPIPRTLHLALSGLRDISLLATPPTTLRSVITRVALYDEQLVRQAILSELERSGQIFFVHNRVKTIEKVYAELVRIVPEARIGVAHGQMDEFRLASVMSDFLDRKIDLLLTTNIIESGLDIPNVNTLIVDNAHKFGLADLHQLRGRVGRHGVQGFAYFLVRAGERLTDTARLRLSAISEHDALGSGFRLALRDLEIRGAGEILGKKQSGHIHAVGYHLYVKMLADTIAQLKRQKNQPDQTVDVDIPAPSFIPEDYIPNLRQRIEFYRAVSEVDDVKELHRITAVLKDRFGPPPPQLKNLLAKTEIAVLLRPFGVVYVASRPQGFLFETNKEQAKTLARLLGSTAYPTPEGKVFLPPPKTVDSEDGEALLMLLVEYLRGVFAVVASG